jgi:Xaa-Pro aminopeptidase
VADIRLDNPPAIPHGEYAVRRDAARTAARERGFDGLLAWSMGGSTLDRYANVFYLSNHYDSGNVFPDTDGLYQGFGMAAMVLPVSGPAILLVNQPDWRTDLVECDEVRTCRYLYDGVAQAIADAGLDGRTIGLTDEERIPVTAHRTISRASPGTRLIGADDLLMGLRVVKSPAEVEMMRYASAVSVEMMSAMMRAAVPGATDADVVAAGFSAGAPLGVHPYDFAMASGPEDGHLWWSRLPSWNHRRRYEVGDIVHPDIYGSVGGYFYDFVRSRVVGDDPSAQQVEILEAAIGCIHAGCAAARPHARGKDIYAAVRRHLVETGLDHLGGADAGAHPSLSDDVLEAAGHGIGAGWERPFLTPYEEMELVPGMTIAVEQHVSRPGVGTVRYEETVLVTESEPEIMTAGCPARWW